MWSKLNYQKAIVFASASVAVMSTIPIFKKENFNFQSKLSPQVRRLPILLKAHAHSQGAIVESESIEEEQKKVKIAAQQIRFMKFASLEFNGECYMTPRDLLESFAFTDDIGLLKKKHFRRVVDEKERDRMVYSTPKKSKGSMKMFRSLDDHGIISYSDYLFLLAVLRKPKSGFRIAFHMLDKDGNDQLDLSEFIMMQRAVVGSNHSCEEEHEDHHDCDKLKPRPTTLLVHFFGYKGHDKLSFDEFGRFIEYFQTEIFEMEFLGYSRGHHFMSEVDFARVLLQFSIIDENQHKEILSRVQNEFSVSKGITFEEYKRFFLFLNNLEDFASALRLYALADKPLSKREFVLAVNAVVGYKLATNIVDTIFLVFDLNGDGNLSHKELLHSLKKRSAKEFAVTKSSKTNDRWDAFKHCMRNKMNEY